MLLLKTAIEKDIDGNIGKAMKKKDIEAEPAEPSSKFLTRNKGKGVTLINLFRKRAVSNQGLKGGMNPGKS